MKHLLTHKLLEVLTIMFDTVFDMFYNVPHY